MINEEMRYEMGKQINKFFLKNEYFCVFAEKIFFSNNLMKRKRRIKSQPEIDTRKYAQDDLNTISTSDRISSIPEIQEVSKLNFKLLYASKIT